jgi:hypothetical protein
MTASEEMLTVAEVAAELRCSKAHVHNAIHGKVAGVSPLPAIHLGRRKIVRRSAFDRWKKVNERPSFDMLPASPEVNAVGPMGGDSHA